MTNSKQIEIENKWQKIWEEKKVFEPKIDNSKKKFFITVPYPYGNSALHIGHGRTNTSADIIARYHRLKGENVLFPMGYHISGSPVLAVADSISRGDKKQIKITREAISDYVKNKEEQDKIIKKFSNPYEIANFFTKTIKNSFKSIGLSIDWRRDFTTGDEIYNKFIEWQYKKLNDLNILVQGKYPILYSPSDKNAVGEDDIKDGDTDKVTIQEMHAIFFKMKDENEYLVASTIRPDAIFGATNIWIHPEMEMLKIKFHEKIIIISEKSFCKLEHQFENLKIISKHKGNEFIDKIAIAPIVNRKIPICEATYLDENHGTGIVYSSPADAPADLIAIFDAQKTNKMSKEIKPIPMVDIYDKKGNLIPFENSCYAHDKLIKFNITNQEEHEKLENAKQELYKEEHYSGKLSKICGNYTGLPIKKAKDEIGNIMLKNNQAFILLETSRRAVTRANDEVIVAKLEGQWFLDYSKEETKKKAYELLDNLKYNPTNLKETQKGYLKWVQLRPCARKRGLGTKLPFDKEWIIEPLSDSTIYQMFYLIVNIIKDKNIDPQRLNYDVFDYVMLGKGNLTLISEETGLEKEILGEMREEVKYWKSFDLRYTAPPHMSNHLSFLIYHYALIFDKEYWPKNITVAGLLIKDGAKISKSKGNGIPLIRIKEKYGVDLYRLYIAIASNYDIEMDFKDDDILQLEKKFEKFKELNEKSINKEPKKYHEFSQINKWLISKFYSRTKTYFEMFENLRIREAFVSILYEFLNDITYHERRTSTEETLEVIKFISEDWIKLLTPATPHFCEEMFEKINKDEFASLSKYETETSKYINKEIEEIEEIVENIISLASKQKETKKITNPKKLTIIQAKDEKFNLFNDIKEQLNKTKNIKEILSFLIKKYPNEKKFISKFVPKTLGNGLSTYLEKEKEKKLLNEIKNFLAKEFNTKIEIIDGNSKENTPNTIMPAKPGVIIE